jgi:hypothetical protein
VTATLLAAEGRSLGRRPWIAGATALGVLLVVVAALVAAAHEGGARVDSYRAGVASMLLLVGMLVAVCLGAAAVNRDADSGYLGLLVAAGAPRPETALARVAGRVAALLAVLVVWGLALQVGSLALGLGLDGPLAVHTLTMAENLALVLLAAAAMSAVLGPVVSGIFGVAVFVFAQGFVNLQAASDQGLIGGWSDVVRAGYILLPRAIGSPMIVDLQARGQAGVAAPRFEVNQTIVHVPAADWYSVLWTLLWCVVFAGLVVGAMRRRPL